MLLCVPRPCCCKLSVLACHSHVVYHLRCNQATTSHCFCKHVYSANMPPVNTDRMQQRANYLPQQTAPAANAALSQDLLRQLQLGQNIRNNAAAAFTPPPQPGLHAYQQPAAHLQQPARLPPQYGGQGPYAQLQAGFRQTSLGCSSTTYSSTSFVLHGMTVRGKCEKGFRGKEERRES